MKHSSGFSLVELLVSIVIMGLLITFVLSPLAQLFQNTSKSSQTLQVTTETQQVVEYIRGQWRAYPISLDEDNVDENVAARAASQSNYDSTCGNLPTNSPGLSSRITVKALDRNATETSTLVDNATALKACGSTLNTAPLKRVTVTTTNSNNVRSSVTIDVARP